MNHRRQADQPQQMDSRRDSVRNLPPNIQPHAGLWLDRYHNLFGPDGAAQSTIECVTKHVKISEEYRHHLTRWKNHLKHLDPARVCVDEAEVQGRMIVGLGAESVLETSIALHRTYGVPYIPGSALKGLASAAAHRLFARDDWRKAVNGKPQGDSHKIMFGDTTSAGYVTFHDALFVPPDGDSSMPLDLDVMTVHHNEYYGSGDKPPADWDSPNPISFVTARGTYLIALEGPREWTDVAMQILAEALEEEGIGAKTAAGYGRMTLRTTQGPTAKQRAEIAARHVERERVDAARKAEAERVDAARKAEAARIENERTIRADAVKDAEFIKKNISKNNAQHYIEKNFANLPADLKTSVAKATIKELKRSWLEARNDQPWVQHVLAAAEEKI